MVETLNICQRVYVLASDRPTLEDINHPLRSEDQLVIWKGLSLHIVSSQSPDKRTLRCNFL